MSSMKYIEEFKAALENYEPSPATVDMLRQVKFVLLAAPTGSGRNTIINELLKTGHYYYVVSDTTRLPRTNNGVMETNGVHYWFRSEDELLRDIQAGKFLEAAIIHNQQVSGISARELARAGSEGRIAVTDMEVVGVDAVLRSKPDTIALFILPPSFEEWQHRLRGRGEMPVDELKRRMESAVKEFKAALSRPYYKFILNDTIADASEQVHKIAFMGEVDLVQQQAHRVLAENLYSKTVAYLDSL